MLVLSRKRNCSIVIPEFDIKIIVIEIRGDKVRLGIEAPKQIDVHRQEVYDAIQRTLNGQHDTAATESTSIELEPGEPDSSKSSDVGEGDASTSPSAPEHPQPQRQRHRLKRLIDHLRKRPADSN